MSAARTNLRVILADGTEHTVTAENPDYVRFDITAAKHGWPGVDKAPFLWLTFIAWSFLTRKGLYAGQFEQFRDEDALHVENLDAADETEAEDGPKLYPATPTPTSPSPSLSPAEPTPDSGSAPTPY